MSRKHRSLVAIPLTILLLATGCHPTQPFYLHEDGDLSHYLDAATEIEYPDLEYARLADVEQSHAPLTLSNPEFQEFWDLRLEEAVSIAMQNSKVLRNLGALTQFQISDGLIGRTAVAPTVFDPALIESDPQFGVEAALSEFDAQLTTNVFWQKTDRPQNFTPAVGFFIPAVLNQDLGQFDAALVKRSATGTTFAVRNQTIYDQNNRGGRVFPSDWFTGFEAEATQPLMRGRGTQVNRVPVILARIRNDISLADFESGVRDMVMDLENAYWDLHFAYRGLETVKISRDSALVTWRTVYAKKAGGAASEPQEAQAREQYFFFRAGVETALRDLFNAETRLRWLMGLAPTDGRLIRPIDEPTTARVAFEWQSVHTEALYRSPELRRQKWAVKQRETEMIAARNQLLPQLDLVATYRWLGSGDELITADRRGLNFPTPGSTAFDELTEGNYQESRLGLQFTPPRIGARRELAGMRNAQLTLARERARLEDMELNLSHVLTTSLQNLDLQFNVAQTHFNRWAALEAEVKGKEAQYEVSVVTLDELLQAQRRRAEAQGAYYRAIVDYNRAIADVHFRKGSLLEYNSIQLAEGPWPKKAYWDALGRARERDASYYLDYGWTRPKVISQGAVEQAPGGGSGSLPPSYETLPQGEPTPAEENGGLMPPESSPPELPMPPRVNGGNDVSQVSTGGKVQPASYEWGDLGLPTKAAAGNPLQATGSLSDGR